MWRPRVVVAAIIERAGRYLMVEEMVHGAPLINQPAGHLDPGESLLDAVRRETLEETACQFEPDHLTGIYQWRAPEGRQFLRFTFCGRLTAEYPERALDHGVLRTLWMDREELGLASQRMRSPLIERSVDDYLAGNRFPLDLLRNLLP